MTNSQPSEIQNQAIDYVTSAAKGALGAIPFAGSLLAEIAGTVIPNQRIDRIADFAAKLQERIEHLESQKITDQLNDEEFTDLVEESLRQASRATTEERRRYLASLLANSITSDAIEHEESKHLLRILGELNDIEVLWLRFFHDPTMGSDTEFRELHKEVFEPKYAVIGGGQKQLDEVALQESYKDHLSRLGLTTSPVSVGRDGNPEIDKIKGDFKRSYTRTSPLGDLLLRSIGLVNDD